MRYSQKQQLGKLPRNFPQSHFKFFFFFFFFGGGGLFFLFVFGACVSACVCVCVCVRANVLFVPLKVDGGEKKRRKKSQT